ncbi:MAG: cytochrome P450 [Deltaproteobacteria bacterium]|nr:cytochrome P450 [Deltaproteobacteria bacterium]
MEIDCNFVQSDSWAGDEMPERMKWLRENDPIFWSEETGLWIITQYAHGEFVSKHQEIFTSEFGIRPGSDTMAGLIDEAEPRHGVLRNMINRGFSPRMVKKLEVTFRQITAEAIDKVADKGECDFVESISVPLPILLIAEMIGIPRQDHEQFHQWSDDLIASDGNHDKPEIMARAGQAFLEYGQYVTELIEEKRRNPQDDLMSILTGAKDDGLLTRQFDNEALVEAQSANSTQLANDELIMLLVVLMVAGNETTRNGISGGMQLLIENPDQRQKLIDDPSLLPSAVEEMVRVATPVRTMGRTLTRDYELGGKQMKKGQEVCLAYPSMNRDAEIYEDPEAFRVERNPQHLGFGIGSHFCLGANLARMEMRVAFEQALQRMPDMAYTRGGPEFRPSSLVRSCTHMWVGYTPES